MGSEMGRPSAGPERVLRAWGAEAAGDDPQRTDAGSSRRTTTGCRRWFVGLGMNEEVSHATVFTRKPEPAGGGRETAVSFGPDREACQAAGWDLERALFGGWNHGGVAGESDELPA